MRKTSSTTPKDHYNLPYWSEGYVRVLNNGVLSIAPEPESESSVDLVKLIDMVREQGLRLPVLVRFPGILHHRVKSLVDAFKEAQAEYSYQGGFTPVYPIKVNQQQPVVEALVKGQIQAGTERIGLEAGSKPELIAVLAQAQGHKATIVCNGYKDAHFIRLALMAEKMGHQVFLVVEKLSELPLILTEAKRLQVTPRLGIRARLASIGKGNWQNTGGEKSKFGLSAWQVLEMVDSLRQNNQLKSLQLLHVHLGSQLANIHDIQTGLSECSRIYAELVQLGVPLTYLDVGGGLGVDYEGTRSRSYCSINYSMLEYARKVVSSIRDVCQQLGTEEPHIITESGRAMTAHHAVMLTEIIDHEGAEPVAIDAPGNDAPSCLAGLYQCWSTLSEQPASGALVELYHDVLHWFDEGKTAFGHGLLTLGQRAQMEQMYSAACQLLMFQLSPSSRAHRTLLDELHEKLAEKVFVNFSLFQSLPDVWGIDQIFPILPVRGHNEPIKHRVVLQDITCDSDGRIDQYVDASGVGSSLPLPRVAVGEPLAIFMVGAYQEILGDLHNLFGDTDSVNVILEEDGTPTLTNIQRGDDVARVLQSVNYDAEDIHQRLLKKVEACGLNLDDKLLIQTELLDSLRAYTYLLPE